MPVTDNAALLRRTSAWRRWLPGAGAALLLLAAGWALVRPVGALVGLEPRDSMSDISYGSGARHKLDVYRPRGADNVPVIVFFYGGRWQSGAKGWYRFLGATLPARGYVVVVPDYRLYPEVKFPEFVMDGAKALQISVDPLPGEANRANNSVTRLMTVDSNKRRILYVEGEPRWEYKFIRRAEDDDKVGIVVGQLFALDGIGGVDVARAVGVEQVMVSTMGQPGDELRQDGPELRLLRLGDDGGQRHLCLV